MATSRVMHHNKINKRVVLSMTENNLDAMLFLLDAGESCLLLQDKTRQRSVSNLRKKVEMAVAQIKIKPRVRSPILNTN